MPSLVSAPPVVTKLWVIESYHKPALGAGLPSRLDKLGRLFGEITQDFTERFREEAR
jgi:hypothetical protein